ncbi:hypothetical protein PaG_02373 [Moesziomyces aphidis]|uniref:Secreted protein n=1 Tax=Moesziomyces aphidis TaxID=84754 RepID=W3VT96_MOEAP|nr:hypothetical protein PaG_02373 [Moesziomyces aphidis]
MMFKSLLAVALVAVSMTAVRAGEVEITVDTHDNTTGEKPKNASIACRIESRSCKSVSHYTDLEYEHNMQVSQCYEPHTIKNWYNRLTPFGHRGMFVDTVYVSCPVPSICKDNKDSKACDFSTNFHDVKPKDVRQLLEDRINEETNCDPRIECYKIEDVDDQCFPKNKDE